MTNYKGQTALHLAAVATNSEGCLHLLLAEVGVVAVVVVVVFVVASSGHSCK